MIYNSLFSSYNKEEFRMKTTKEVLRNAGKRTAKRGFTLIELLVVIAIVSLLAAILFPVFARARENARRASCQSNLKQIGLGIAQYRQDYDEKYFICVMGVSNYGSLNEATFPQSIPAGGTGWVDLMQPYTKSLQVFQCPSERHAAGTNPNTYGYSDYAYNAVIGYTSVSGTYGYNSLNESSIPFPATVVMVTDSYRAKDTGNGEPVRTTSAMAWTVGCAGLFISGCNGANENGYEYGKNEVTDGESTFTGRKGSFRHLDGANYLFCDGHVKWYAGDWTTGVSKKVKHWYGAANNGTDPSFRPW
jgi:prepilin-type N-terminal cleavage/methylation domain-containing protein/prepilin-type processing-associated H-X9-DG protein